MKKLALAATLLLATAAHAARIADVTSTSNQRTYTVTGLGLVFGLKGSGDGGDFLPAIQMLASALSKYDNSVRAVDLKSVKNVALVSLTAKLPATGTHPGESVDVYVNSIGSASSLKDGHLFVTPMQFLAGVNDQGKPIAQFVGTSTGLLSIEGGSSATSTVIRGGLTIEHVLPIADLSGNSFSLYLDSPSASWTMASNIAKRINDEGSLLTGQDAGSTYATAVSENEVVVAIPPGFQQNPANYVAAIQQMDLPLVPAEARVVINEKTGTIVVTGDVEISPVVISHKGLTITTVEQPARPVPSRQPTVKTSEWAKLDTANTGGSKLQDLLSAMDQLKVPVQDRIDIIKGLHKSSKLHAKLEME